MSHLVKRRLGRLAGSLARSGGGDIASRLMLTSEDEDETDEDGPFYAFTVKRIF